MTGISPMAKCESVPPHEHRRKWCFEREFRRWRIYSRTTPEKRAFRSSCGVCEPALRAMRVASSMWVDSTTRKKHRQIGDARVVEQDSRKLNHLYHITPVACISSKRSFVYHQHKVLYIIKSQGNTRWRVMIYTFGDEMRLTAMIYQVCDLDKQKPHPVSVMFLTKKSR